MSLYTTYLEMRSAEDLRPKPARDPLFTVREATVKQWQVNRFFYQLVGASWNWRDKLAWTPEQWRLYAEAAELRTWMASYGGSPAGYFELRTDAERAVEVVYLGLAPAFIGRGLGGPLLTAALEAAWAMQPARVWLHTCTDDHPAALGNYLARGMKIYRVKPGPHSMGGDDASA